MTLSQELGALTLLWVVSLSEWQLTRHPSLLRSTALHSSEFDSGLEVTLQGSESVALPVQPPRSRLDFGLFRKEPAIADLD